MRIYYVAATRAIDNLFIIACERTRKAPLKTPRQRLVRTTAGKTVPSTRLSWRTRPPFRLLSTAAHLLHPDGKQLRSELGANFSPDDAESPITVNHLHSSDVERSVEKGDRNGRFVRRKSTKNISKSLKGDMKYEYDFNALSALCAKISVSALTHKSKLSESFAMRPAFLQNEALSAAEKGTAMHSFMQYSDYISAKTIWKTRFLCLRSNGSFLPFRPTPSTEKACGFL